MKAHLRKLGIVCFNTQRAKAMRVGLCWAGTIDFLRRRSHAKPASSNRRCSVRLLSPLVSFIFLLTMPAVTLALPLRLNTNCKIFLSRARVVARGFPRLAFTGRLPSQPRRPPISLPILMVSAIVCNEGVLPSGFLTLL